jgi:hypothetical protein
MMSPIDIDRPASTPGSLTAGNRLTKVVVL